MNESSIYLQSANRHHSADPARSGIVPDNLLAWPTNCADEKEVSLPLYLVSTTSICNDMESLITYLQPRAHVPVAVHVQKVALYHFH